METHIPDRQSLIMALGRLTLDEVTARLRDLDAERAALSLLRRSLAARDRCRRRADRHMQSAETQR
jgi:hypothetical protein